MQECKGYPFHPYCNLWVNEMATKLSQQTLHKYAKSRAGYSAGHEISPYQVACKGLELDGKPLPSATTYKKWVQKNADFINEEVAKLPAVINGNPRAQPTQNKTTEKRPRKARRGPRQTTESSVAYLVSKSAIDPTTDAFLESFEWRSIRMMALKKHGATCQCCGASPATGAVMHVDHVKPRKFFPELALSLDNLQVLCAECNHGKGNWDMTDWRKMSA
jgi:5-methylcytosine-specific restriction endonuclease McrA